jgi:excisionase family DNA binding protein
VLPDPNDRPTLSVDEAAVLLGISRSACYRAVAAGQVPGLRFGRTWRVPTGPLVSLLGLNVGQALAFDDGGSGDRSALPALRRIRGRSA